MKALVLAAVAVFALGSISLQARADHHGKAHKEGKKGGKKGKKQEAAPAEAAPADAAAPEAAPSH